MTTSQEYLISEFWVLSWAASVQRSKLFRKRTKKNQRDKFRREVIAFIESELIQDYCTTVTECQHIKNIQRLSCKGTDLGGAWLRKDGYKIGVAQKLLNLQLKYLWCLGLVAEPPHCPVDRVIINKTHLKNQVSWTQITEIEDYKKIISALKMAAQPTSLSLSHWELSTYDRRGAQKNP